MFKDLKGCVYPKGFIHTLSLSYSLSFSSLMVSFQLFSNVMISSLSKNHKFCIKAGNEMFIFVQMIVLFLRKERVFVCVFIQKVKSYCVCAVKSR